MRHSFFVYGSFSEGQVHFNKFAQLIVSQKSAFMKADAYRLRCGYPILSPNPEGDLVQGVLVELEAPDTFWPILDELLGVDASKAEKCFLQRQTCQVMVDNFSQTEAQVYVINPHKVTHAHRPIPGGAWQDDMIANPPMPTQLQDRHRNYIAKLSKSRGRDIVPIKLDLYRELMAMELIVDKGRRLALTQLGKEASLFVQ